MPFTTEAPAAPLRDQLSINTPELVAIEFPLAGIGSRFIAVLLDYVLQAVFAFLLLMLFAFILSGTGASRTPSSSSSSPAGKWAVAILIAIPFLFEWAYFALFEAFWRGQTPGKRIMNIRVIQQTGRPITLIESLGRNLLRFVDMLPALYVAGIVSMFVTRRQQRLGDLVAGTLVVHEQPSTAVGEIPSGSRTFTAAVFEPTAAPQAPPKINSIPADALSALTLADLQALESYLSRRLDVPLETRERLATRLRSMITSKAQISVPMGMSQETFLEEVASALRSGGARPLG